MQQRGTRLIPKIVYVKKKEREKKIKKNRDMGFTKMSLDERKKFLYKQLKTMEAAMPQQSSPGSTSASAPSPSTPSSSASPTSSHCFSLLRLDLGLNVHQQGIKWEAVWKDKVANVVATNTEGLQLGGLSVLKGHLHCLQVSVHANIHTCNGAMDLSSIFEFNGHSLMTELHQKPY